MKSHQYDVVICGAGIAGISSAYHLSVVHGIQNILLIDPLPPLSMTSDKSTECYRNWWPGPGDAMVSLMNRSIVLLERLADQSGNLFHLNRRGYLYLTANEDQLEQFIRFAKEPSVLGAGPLRIHKQNNAAYSPSSSTGNTEFADGADLILNQELIRKSYPFLSNKVVAALHVRKAGWFSAQQLGMHLLAQARLKGINVLKAEVTGIVTSHNKIKSVQIDQSRTIDTHCFINAAGPFFKNIGNMAGIELPVFCELHQKAAIKDHLQVIPRDVPLLIWKDSQYLNWTDEERKFLEADPPNRWLLNEMPSGVHTRPEGSGESQVILMLWEYHTTQDEPIIPPKLDEQYPAIVMRGLTTMIPDLEAYSNKPPRPYLDGGYYTKTIENRPIIGPSPIAGIYLIGALSGFGLMSAMAAGELLALHITNNRLPGYTQAFCLDRYKDVQYLEQIKNWNATGQL